VFLLFMVLYSVLLLFCVAEVVIGHTAKEPIDKPDHNTQTQLAPNP
jgi:hypothetical protein